VLTGGRLTVEDAYAYSKFARVALGTNDIDFRSRPHSAEEAEFLASHVVARSLEVTYADLERASKVVLVGLEPEDESPILFLRLRKAALRGTKVFSLAPFTSRGLQKMSGTLVRTAPGDEARAVEALAHDGEVALDGGGVILVGERLATVPGALSAVAALAGTTGARLAWVPRRAGDRGAVEVGCLPNLLPGGRPVSVVDARVDAGAAWGVTSLPDRPGRDGDQIVAAAAAGELKGLVVAGVDPADLGDPALAVAALETADFVVSLEVRASEVSPYADVVLPVAPVTDKAGSFVDWEGRVRSFGQVFQEPSSLPEVRILAGIAEEMGVGFGIRTTEQARAEMESFGAWEGERLPAPTTPAASGADLSEGHFLLATWKLLIDDGRMLDGDEYLKATGRRAVALVSPSTLRGLGVDAGQLVTIATDRGSMELPVGVADLPDHVVWAPSTAVGMSLSRELGTVTAGTVVRLEGVVPSLSKEG
jgi:NADH-quinone oxidoreductase subunit G